MYNAIAVRMVGDRCVADDRHRGEIFIERYRKRDRREYANGSVVHRAPGSKTRDPRAPDRLLVLPGVRQDHQVHRPEQNDDHRVFEHGQGIIY